MSDVYIATDYQGFDPMRLPGGQRVVFEDYRRKLLEEPKQVEPKVRNVIVPRMDLERDGAHFCSLRAPLRVSVEAYPNNEYIAVLVAEPTITGYGDSLDEAVTAALMMFADDFTFYVENDDSDLTRDALELKAKLLSFFDLTDGTR